MNDTLLFCARQPELKAGPCFGAHQVVRLSSSAQTYAAVHSLVSGAPGVRCGAPPLAADAAACRGLSSLKSC